MLMYGDNLCEEDFSNYCYDSVNTIIESFDKDEIINNVMDFIDSRQGEETKGWYQLCSRLRNYNNFPEAFKISVEQDRFADFVEAANQFAAEIIVENR